VKRFLVAVFGGLVLIVMLGIGTGPANAALCDPGQVYQGGGTPCVSGDNDGDRLTNDYEINVSQTDPDDPDSDGDNCDDGSEVEAGTDPNDPGEEPAICPVQN
jgi:hypothetical protein